MAYALNYPNAPTDAAAGNAAAAPESTAPRGFFARALAAIQESQMRRAARELALVSPDLYESLNLDSEFRRITLSRDADLPFVK